MCLMLQVNKKNLLTCTLNQNQNLKQKMELPLKKMQDVFSAQVLSFFLPVLLNSVEYYRFGEHGSLSGFLSTITSLPGLLLSIFSWSLVFGALLGCLLAGKTNQTNLFLEINLHLGIFFGLKAFVITIKDEVPLNSKIQMYISTTILLAAGLFRILKTNAIRLEEYRICYQKWNTQFVLPYLARIIILSIISMFPISAALVWCLLLGTQILLLIHRLRIQVYFSIKSQWWSMIGEMWGWFQLMRSFAFISFSEDMKPYIQLGILILPFLLAMCIIIPVGPFAVFQLILKMRLNLTGKNQKMNSKYLKTLIMCTLLSKQPDDQIITSNFSSGFKYELYEFLDEHSPQNDNLSKDLSQDFPQSQETIMNNNSKVGYSFIENEMQFFEAPQNSQDFRPFPLLFSEKKFADKINYFYKFIIFKVFSHDEVKNNINILLFVWNFILRNQCISNFNFYILYYAYIEKKKGTKQLMDNEQRQIKQFFEIIRNINPQGGFQKMFFKEFSKVNHVNNLFGSYVKNQMQFSQEIAKTTVDLKVLNEYWKNKINLQQKIEMELYYLSFHLGKDPRYFEKDLIFRKHILNMQINSSNFKMPEEMNLSKKMRDFRIQHSEILVVSGMRALGEVTYTNQRFKNLFGLSSKVLKLSNLLPSQWRNQHREAILDLLKGSSQSKAQTLYFHNPNVSHFIVKSVEGEFEQYYQVENLTVIPYLELFSDLQFLISMNIKTQPAIIKFKPVKVRTMTQNTSKFQKLVEETQYEALQLKKTFTVFNKEYCVEYQIENNQIQMLTQTNKMVQSKSHKKSSLKLQQIKIESNSQSKTEGRIQQANILLNPLKAVYKKFLFFFLCVFVCINGNIMENYFLMLRKHQFQLFEANYYRNQVVNLELPPITLQIYYYAAKSILNFDERSLELVNDRIKGYSKDTMYSQFLREKVSAFFMPECVYETYYLQDQKKFKSVLGEAERENIILQSVTSQMKKLNSQNWVVKDYMLKSFTRPNIFKEDHTLIKMIQAKFMEQAKATSLRNNVYLAIFGGQNLFLAIFIVYSYVSYVRKINSLSRKFLEFDRKSLAKKLQLNQRTIKNHISDTFTKLKTSADDEESQENKQYERNRIKTQLSLKKSQKTTRKVLDILEDERQKQTRNFFLNPIPFLIILLVLFFIVIFAMLYSFSSFDSDIRISATQDEGIVQFSHFLLAYIRMYKGLSVDVDMVADNNGQYSLFFTQYSYIRQVDLINTISKMLDVKKEEITGLFEEQKQSTSEGQTHSTDLQTLIFLFGDLKTVSYEIYEIIYNKNYSRWFDLGAKFAAAFKSLIESIKAGEQVYQMLEAKIQKVHNKKIQMLNVCAVLILGLLIVSIVEIFRLKYYSEKLSKILLTMLPLQVLIENEVMKQEINCLIYKTGFAKDL